MGDYCRFSNEVFYGTEPIEGCDDWLIISDFPVELSRHTRMKCITKVVMLVRSPAFRRKFVSQSRCPSSSAPEANELPPEGGITNERY